MWWIKRGIFSFIIWIAFLFGQGGPVGCGDVVIDQIPFNYQGSTLGAGDSIDVTEWGQANSEDFIFTLNVVDTILIDFSVCHAFTDFDIQMGVFEFNDTCGVDTIGPPTCRYPTGDQGAGAGYDCYSEDTQSCTESMASTIGTSIEGTPEYRGMIFEYQLYPLDGADTTTYFIVIDGYNTTGNFQLSIDYSAPPFIVSSNLDPTNNWIDITTNEGVYDNNEPWNGAPFAIQVDDFTIEFQQNGGLATEVAIQGISKQDGSPLEGGESMIRLALNVGGAASGVETIEIKPANANSVFDGGGVAMGNTSSTGTIFLNEQLPPLMNSSQSILATDNSYAALSISEGIFTNNDGSGALLVSDFSVDFNANGGTASGVDIQLVTKPGGNSLTGGEDSLWIYLNVTGSPSGVETIIIRPENNDAIFDANGNAMSIASTSDQLTLFPFPRIIADQTQLSGDNVYVKLFMSEGVYGNSSANTPMEVSDLQVVFTQNAGNATGTVLTSITKTNGSVLAGGEDSLLVYFTLSNPPASGTESIEIKSVSNNSIFNSIGNPLVSIETTGPIQLNDKWVPTFINAELSLDSAVTVTISEGIYTNADGTGSVLPADFAIDVDQNGGNASSASITQLTRMDESGLVGGETDILVHFTTTDLSSGVEQIEIRPATDASVYDLNGNAMQMAMSSGEVTLKDFFPPIIRSSSNLIWDNQIEVKFSEGSYSTNSGSGGLDDSDFELEFFNNGGNANAVSIGSVTSEWNTALSGGELIVRLHLDFDFPPSGVETIRAFPMNENTIFDESGNAMFPTETTPTFQLNDKLPPSITEASLDDQETIPLIFAQEIEFSISEPLKSFDLQVATKFTDSLKFSVDTTISVMKLTLFPPFASLDTITITWDNLKDSANAIHDPQVIYTYYTPALGDFDMDDDIDATDLSELVSSWYQKDYDSELGPVTGTLPHYIIQTDAEFGLDDGMAFVQMWYWKNQLNSLSRPLRTTNGKKIELRKFNHSFSVIPPKKSSTGQVYLEYNPMILELEHSFESSSPSQITLTQHNKSTGKFLFEFAGLDNIELPDINFKTSFRQKNETNPILVYAFYDQDGSIISEGTESLEILSIPKEFALHPVFPNPFNPIATIRFDIPVEMLHTTSIRIYDITGRMVETLMDGEIETGFHEISWDGHNQSSGVYFAELMSGDVRKIRRMILLK
ncbi:MAG: T9SS type A sorting domain-containing protein [Candidatus Marinimicrobia bacterium]|jgi:hypothetical protein|nr:T9SS type A sorting domain-containing protein [Candidatus Neomarinimicrobiota bacterium]MBT3618254.1 T9SS type A sorting domain-containing protein [Candidatus Neomarinimicrobiota bacterium]MBT3829580.1 T9SS type A sorting domain-containing protein [Candidatus Neomarinimicrobiota bacterium]MBT3997463.1 T9SS type A sorting domain-containing protein [Candidatus Neomarinimicrobiota bacterium]MBT4281653.1 T9SS type A sorting domain-containing protein [Candidatus Neomarinimicrobiota bacterium]